MSLFLNYCVIYLTLTCSVVAMILIKFKGQYSLSIEVRSHLSYSNIIRLSNSSETNRIVKAVKGFLFSKSIAYYLLVGLLFKRLLTTHIVLMHN